MEINLIVDSAMEEVLLGRPLLHAIGFILRDHLKRFQSIVNDKHVGELEATKFILSAASYRKLSYMSSNDDPIYLLEGLTGGIGKTPKKAYGKHFKRFTPTQSQVVYQRKV